MKPRHLLLAVACATIGWSGAAKASIVPVFSVNPSPVGAGDSAELDLTLSVSADPGFFNAKFSVGLVTLSSGNGHLDFFTVTPGLTTQTFSAVFDYPSVGTFTPSFAYAATYTEQFSVGRHTFTVPNIRFGDGRSTLTVAPAETNAPAVPELSTWAMMILGFACVGLTAYRRRSGGVPSAA